MFSGWDGSSIRLTETVTMAQNIKTEKNVLVCTVFFVAWDLRCRFGEGFFGCMHFASKRTAR